MIDGPALSQQLVRELRGDRSQRALSRRLQYTTNVVYLWESGRRWPTAAAFLWLAQRTGRDVPAQLEHFAPGVRLDSPPHTAAGVAALLRHLKGSQTAAALAEQVGVSRHTVGRWLRGQAEPRLPDFLAVVEASTNRMLDFVALWCDPTSLPAAAESWVRLEAARRMSHALPWAPAVLLALELAAYQRLPAHDDGWLARRLGLAAETVSRCLQVLAAAGQIRRARRRWERVEIQAVDTQAAPNPTDLKQWWAQTAVDRMATAEGLTSFNVFTVSQDDLDRLLDLQRQHYRAMRALIAASAPGERVVLTCLHTLALDTPQPQCPAGNPKVPR